MKYFTKQSNWLIPTVSDHEATLNSLKTQTKSNTGLRGAIGAGIGLGAGIVATKYLGKGSTSTTGKILAGSALAGGAIGAASSIGNNKNIQGARDIMGIQDKGQRDLAIKKDFKIKQMEASVL